MASLKEVKRRIISVEGTKKITVARQMIASALLHKTQDTLLKTQAYKESIDDLYSKVSATMDDDTEYNSQNGVEREKTGIIIISSNSGMCGPFNMNIIKAATSLEETYPNETLVYYPIGKKVREALLHRGYTLGYEKGFNMDYLIDKPSFKKSTEAIRYFSGIFNSGIVDRIIVICTHFKTVASQKVLHIPLLPYTVNDDATECNFIIEPSPEIVMNELLERSLRAAFHTIIIDSLTSEYAARTIAMQLASENANELLNELHITYNKLRQQNITSELLDIVGSSFA